jgi:hypothetical protein
LNEKLDQVVGILLFYLLELLLLLEEIEQIMSQGGRWEEEGARRI